MIAMGTAQKDESSRTQHRWFFSLAFFFVCTLLWILIAASLLLFPVNSSYLDSPFLSLPLFVLTLSVFLTYHLIDKNILIHKWLVKKHNGPALFAIGALNALGVFLVYCLPTMTDYAPLLFISVGELLIGSAISVSILLIYYGVFPKHNLFTIIRYTGASFGTATLICGLLVLFWGAQAEVALLLVSLVLPVGLRLIKQETPPALTYKPLNMQKISDAPTRSNLSSIFTGISFGFFVRVFPISPFTPTILLSEIVALFLVLILLLSSYSLLKRNPNDAIFQIGLPLMALSYLVSLLSLPYPASVAIQLAGAAYTVMLGISISVLLISNYNIAFLSILKTFGYIFLGYALGTGFGLLVSPLFVEQGLLLLLFALLFSAILLVKERKLKFGWIRLDIGDHYSDKDFFKYACEIVGREHLLTRREQEVLILLANGRNKNSISRQLMVSEETVKSHQKNIYRKLGIHTQQEAITLAYNKVEELAQG